MGRHFWVGCGCFFYYFLGGVVEGKMSSRVRVAEKFSRDERAPNRPVCVIYYMFSSGGFTSTCLQVITKGGSSLRWDSRGGSRPGPRDPGLQKPWIPGKDLGPGQIPHIYSNRLKFFAIPCPETCRHTGCVPSLFEEFFFFQKDLF